MTADEHEWASSELKQHGAALWYGVLAGPIGWTVQLLVTYAMAALTCGHGWPGFTILGLSGGQTLMTIFTVVIELLIVAAFVLAAREWRRTAHESPWFGTHVGRWMAGAGMLLSGMFFVAVFFSGVPAIALNPCR